MVNFSFCNVSWFSGEKLTCNVSDCVVNEENRRLKFDLSNLKGRNASEVQAIRLLNSKVSVFPRNLTETFPNLTALFIHHCGLTEISKYDLIGLEELVELNIRSNELRSLPKDLMVNMKNLKWISLKESKLEFMDSQMFDGVKSQLKRVDIRFTDGYSECFDCNSKLSIDNIMTFIDNKCLRTKPSKETENFPEKASNIFENLWLTRRFSDFTIVVEKEEFKVHKNVLAMQSEVFAAMFENNLEERKTNRLPISNFSSAAIGDFLRFLYTGKIEDELNAMELFTLAALYNVADLKLMTENLLLYNIDEENSFKVLEFGNLHESEALIEKAFKFVKSAHPEINFNDTLKKTPEALKILIEAKWKYVSAVEEARKELEAVMNR